MLWNVFFVFLFSMWLVNSIEGHYQPPKGSFVWGYFTPPVLQQIKNQPRQTAMEEMVDLTNNLGVAILQDHSFSRSNFAFSPYGVASVLVVLYEGARGESAKQIQRAIQFPADKDIIRIGFRDIHRHLRNYFSHEGYLSGISLNKESSSLKPEYKKILRFYGYDVDLNQPLDEEDEFGYENSSSDTSPTPEIQNTATSSSTSASTITTTTLENNKNTTEGDKLGKDQTTLSTVSATQTSTDSATEGETQKDSTTSSTTTEKFTQKPSEPTVNETVNTTTAMTTEIQDEKITPTEPIESQTNENNCEGENCKKETTTGATSDDEQNEISETQNENLKESSSTTTVKEHLVENSVTEAETEKTEKVEDITNTSLDNGMLIPQPEDLTTKAVPEAQSLLKEITLSADTTLLEETTLPPDTLPTEAVEYKETMSPVETTSLFAGETTSVEMTLPPSTMPSVETSSFPEKALRREMSTESSSVGTTEFIGKTQSTRMTLTETSSAGTTSFVERSTFEEKPQSIGKMFSETTLSPTTLSFVETSTFGEKDLRKEMSTESSSVSTASVETSTFEEKAEALRSAKPTESSSVSTSVETSTVAEKDLRREMSTEPFSVSTISVETSTLGEKTETLRSAKLTESSSLSTTPVETLTEKTAGLRNAKPTEYTTSIETTNFIEKTQSTGRTTSTETSSETTPSSIETSSSPRTEAPKTTKERFKGTGQLRREEPKGQMRMEVKNDIKMSSTKEEKAPLKSIRSLINTKMPLWLNKPQKEAPKNIYPRKGILRKTRTITDYLKSPHNPDLSLQLQNGMYDTHVSRNANLYRSLPRLLFLVDGAVDTPVPMMTYTNVFNYAYIPRLHSKALEFPLDDIRYKLLILLPVERRGLRQLIYDLSDFPLCDVLDSVRPTRVKAMVPTFMVEGFVILTSSLQKLGIWDVFDPRKANLSGMTMDPELYVRNVEQSVTVVIRNYVEILDIQTRTMAARDLEQEFEATHPFLYFVLDTDTNVALMAGQILDPLNSRIY